MDYGTGVILSLLWSLFWFAFGLASRASVMHKNFALAGMRRSWATGQYKEGGSFLWELPVWFCLTLIAAAFSWLGVAVQIGSWLWVLAKDIGAPRAVKDARWRLKNVAFRTSAEAAAAFADLASASLGRPLSAEEREEVAAELAERVKQPDPKAREARAEEMYDLRYPQLLLEREEGDSLKFEIWADLERMLLVEESDDFDHHHTRVFDLQRLHGPVWQARERAESWHRTRPRLERLPMKSEEIERELAKGPQWATIQFPKLEPSYQEFIARFRKVRLFMDPLSRAIEKDHDRAEGPARSLASTKPELKD